MTLAKFLAPTMATLILPDGLKNLSIIFLTNFSFQPSISPQGLTKMISPRVFPKRFYVPHRLLEHQ